MRSQLKTRPERTSLNVPSQFFDYFYREIQPHSRIAPAGTEVCHQGTENAGGTWLLHGWLGVTKLFEDGRRILIDVALPIDFVSALKAGDSTAHYGVTALTGAIIAPLRNTSPGKQVAATDGLSDFIRELQDNAAIRQAERMIRIGWGTAHERIAHTLIELYLRLGGDPEGTDRCAVDLPITQRDIGNLTGLTAIHVCRTIKSLQEQGILTLRKHRLTINDLRALAAIGETDVDYLQRHILPPHQRRETSHAA